MIVQETVERIRTGKNNGRVIKKVFLRMGGFCVRLSGRSRTLKFKLTPLSRFYSTRIKQKPKLLKLWFTLSWIHVRVWSSPARSGLLSRSGDPLIPFARQCAFSIQLAIPFLVVSLAALEQSVQSRVVFHFTPGTLRIAQCPAIVVSLYTS